MNIGIGISLANYRPVPTAPLEDPDAAIAALFSSGEVGAWYDPSDSTTVFQDANGTTPAGVGDPVGLILDKSQGLTLGSELVTNGAFDTAASWTLGTGWSISGGKADAVSVGGAAYLQQPLTPSPGYYKITFDVVSYTSGNLKVFFGGVFTGTVASGTGSYSAIIYSTGAGTSVRFSASTANFTGSIDNVSVRELPGNHATQTTSAARPVLQSSGGLYYLDFDGVDDYMATTFAAVQAQPNSIGIGAKFDNYASKNYDFIYDSPDGNYRHALYDINGNTQITTAYQTVLTISASNLSDNVYFSHYNSTTSFVRLNGSLAGSGSLNPQGWSGIVLGNYTLYNLGFDGRIYSYVGVNRTLTAGEITDLETYLASKSGVTI